MQKKSTSKLEQNLKSYNSIKEYVDENKDEFIHNNLEEQLQHFIVKKGLTKSEVVKGSNLNEVYAYQILSGVRKPSRDKLLCICFGMKADLKEAQNILKQNCFGILYPRNKRDSVIIYGLEHGMSIMSVNEELFDLGEKVLE